MKRIFIICISAFLFAFVLKAEETEADAVVWYPYSRGPMEWQEAVEFCTNMGRRLPTKEEATANFKTAREYRWIWTSTEIDSLRVYVVFLENALVSRYRKTGAGLNYARCVH